MKNMSPREIKAALVLHGVTQTSIAKQRKVSQPHVNRVINGATSDHVRRAIAKAINKDVKEVWPEYYLRDVLTP